MYIHPPPHTRTHTVVSVLFSILRLESTLSSENNSSVLTDCKELKAQTSILNYFPLTSKMGEEGGSIFVKNSGG